MTAALEVNGLEVAYRAGRGFVPVVRGVDLTLARGKVLALLGESGSGKSVTLRSMVGLTAREGARVAGSVRVLGQDVPGMTARQQLDLRGSQVGFVFQEPMTALDPVFRVGDQIAEVLVRHRGATWAEGLARARALFDLVQIPAAAQRLRAYPSELSGGLRQRAMIAIALACEPPLLLADEPTTALDATVQIQVLLLLRDLQKQLGTAVVFVTHDLGVAAEIADEVAVMYAGRIVERGSAEQVLLAPAHPYTRALLGCVVRGGYAEAPLVELAGSPPDLARLPPGCSFAPRCGSAFGPCGVTEPAEVARPSGHRARCHLPLPLDDRGDGHAGAETTEAR
ncbi:ABC transporter ATP-binding protein [Falsiroseomonas stagni]|uniref:Peptide/nickel transport system ATP-binding protein n=1 Tax=Falsiroseomonas stagni DSM 19981 TaxID=1123062 RepID=A0A1I3ZPE4_9PROT|nr:ABC transporter ATP-binding protein [Falsiroseomonas stagni]SFK46014.1 peptide/nickel transport system ATP-binding protein [Falsiroseomonas stagni DSM 19981]